MEKVPARYIGDIEKILPANLGPYFDGDGNLLEPTLEDAVTHEKAYGIRPGDTLMITAAELYGQTYLHDRNQVELSEYIGTGHVVKPEHADLSKDELTTAVDGHYVYDFHEGRADFEPYEPQEKQQEVVSLQPSIPITPVSEE